MIKAFLKNILNSYRHSAYFFSVDNVIRIYTPGAKTVLHIGANHGQELEAYERNGIQKVIWCEGLPEALTVLKKKLSGSKIKNVLVEGFLSDRDDDSFMLREASNSGSSTLLAQKEEIEGVTFKEKGMVHTKRLDTLFNELNLPATDIDLVLLDVEGFEYKVLSGMGHVMDSAKWVICEFSIRENHAGCPVLSDLDDLLLKNNFVRIKNWLGVVSGDALYRKQSSISSWEKLRMNISSSIFQSKPFQILLWTKWRLRQLILRSMGIQA